VLRIVVRGRKVSWYPQARYSACEASVVRIATCPMAPKIGVCTQARSSRETPTVCGVTRRTRLRRAGSMHPPTFRKQTRGYARSGQPSLGASKPCRAYPGYHQPDSTEESRSATRGTPQLVSPRRRLVIPRFANKMPNNRMHLTGYSGLRPLPPAGDAGRSASRERWPQCRRSGYTSLVG
jgi:hypothetical protein